MVKEIDWVSKQKIEYLHLIDNNFGMYKDHKIISDLLIKKLETEGYPNALNITWAKHKKPYLFDIAEDLLKVGLNKSVTIALQSMNSPTLKAVEYAECISTYAFHACGLPTKKYILVRSADVSLGPSLRDSRNCFALKIRNLSDIIAAI